MTDAFLHAIRTGDLEGVRRLLEQGIDVNSRMSPASDHGLFFLEVTPLMVAVAARGSTADIVRILLEHGADPFALSAGDVSATWYASGGGIGHYMDDDSFRELGVDHPLRHWGGGDVERLQLMLDAGGDPNESASNGRNCVSEACSAGDERRLQLLIERGASVYPSLPVQTFDLIDEFRRDINAIAKEQGFNFRAMNFTLEYSYQTVPLFQAALSGNVNCVKLIVEAGFPADYAVDGQNALADCSSGEVAAYLWGQGVRLGKFSFESDALDSAIRENRIEVVRYLIDQVDQTRLNQALISASGHLMNPNVLRLFLDKCSGTDLSQTVKKALFDACWQGQRNEGREDSIVVETLHLLIDAGADPNCATDHGVLPLHEAIEGDWESPAAVSVLLKHGANANGRLPDGRTPLMLAVSQTSVDCVQLLLDAGADPKLRDRSGKDALRYAQKSAKMWTKHNLFTRFVNKQDPFFRQRGDDARRIVEMLRS